MNRIYKIMLVDDELIILSGLKFLINWSNINCKIVATASNGRDALEKIDQYKPDIIICDINMPVHDGVHVLKTIQASSNDSVFIMLSNHQEFHLVQQSLKHQAVDYILKTNLNPDMLIQSIENAKKACDNRKKLLKVDLVENYLSTKSTETAIKCLQQIFNNPVKDLPVTIYNICREAGFFNHYRLLQLYILPPKVMHYESFTSDEKNKLYQCEKDIINKICDNFYEHYLILPQCDNSLLIYIYQAQDVDATYIKQFYERLAAASRTMVETPIQITATLSLDGEEQLPECLSQWHYLQKSYFYQPEDMLFYSPDQDSDFCNPIDLSKYIHQLRKELISSNISGVVQELETLVQQLSQANDEPQNVINNIVNIYNTILSTLQDSNYTVLLNKAFPENTEAVDLLGNMHTFQSVVEWIYTLCNKLQKFYQLVHSNHNNLIGQAREYIIQNIQQKLTLSSVANYLCITPSYLSTLFKKECQQNFVDYVNQLKIQKACILLQENKLLIYEIAHALGFDNPYYFTRIFRKYKEMTPKEYMMKFRNGR